MFKSRKPIWNADKLILARRECEFEVFQSIEEYLTLPRIKEGFERGGTAHRRKSRLLTTFHTTSKMLNAWWISHFTVDYTAIIVIGIPNCKKYIGDIYARLN